MLIIQKVGKYEKKQVFNLFLFLFSYFMLIIQPSNLQREMKTFSRKIHGSCKQWKIVKVTAYVCKHTGVFHGCWETLNKRNKKNGTCYNNFALRKIEIIVAVKHQK